MYPDDTPRRAKLAILSEQQGHRCCYCGVRFVDDPGPPPDIRLYFDPRPSVEHVVRIADNGKKTWRNEVAACRGCNSARGEIEPAAFYALVSRGDLPALRHALRSSVSAKRRSRDTLREIGPSHRVVRQKGKWPPVVGELLSTPGRQAYFELVYGPWKGDAAPPAPAPVKAPKKSKRCVKDDPRFVMVAGILAARWDVKNLPSS